MELLICLFYVMLVLINVLIIIYFIVLVFLCVYMFWCMDVREWNNAYTLFVLFDLK